VTGQHEPRSVALFFHGVQMRIDRVAERVEMHMQVAVR
jgi:hypothetical protein